MKSHKFLILMLSIVCVIAWGNSALCEISVEPAAVVSGPSLFEQGCDGGPSFGSANYNSYEVEPYVAVNPLNPLNMVVTWQQDRWQWGSANGIVAATTHDGGVSWQRAIIPHLTVCSGGAVQRTGDPWLSFGPNGELYHAVVAHDADFTNGRVLVSKSLDGGDTWGEPVIVHANVTPNEADDKESITADPFDSRYAYVMWSKNQFASGMQPTIDARHTRATKMTSWFARTIDGGSTWEPGRMIFDPGELNAVVGHQIVVLPNGDLINVFTMIAARDYAHGLRGRYIFMMRSDDKGETWSEPVNLGKIDVAYADDPETGEWVFSGTGIVDIDVDKRNGGLYIVWEDGRFSDGMRDAIAFMKSTDGGSTWSAPVQVNKAINVSAFLPSVSVADDGAVAVTYYDYRNDNSDPSTLLTDHWVVVSRDGGESWTEAHVAGPFDMRSAPEPGAWWYFIGDYVGLANAGNSFVAAFPMSNFGISSNPTDIFVSKIVP